MKSKLIILVYVIIGVTYISSVALNIYLLKSGQPVSQNNEEYSEELSSLNVNDEQEFIPVYNSEVDPEFRIVVRVNSFNDTLYVVEGMHLFREDGAFLTIYKEKKRFEDKSLALKCMDSLRLDFLKEKKGVYRNVAVIN